MKKQLSSMTNEKGFILPLVLLVTALVFIIITSNITAYRGEIDLTESYLAQVKMETLFQMGRTQLKKELPTLQEIPDRITYQFPDGSVDITIDSFEGNLYNLVFNIETAENHFLYFTQNTLYLNVSTE